MKYIVVLCDGMADEPLDVLGEKTPLEAARTHNMDGLSKVAEIGMVRTVPVGMAPGSDTANLSVLGYDPEKYYSGRSPLEALSIGAPMGDADVAFRCNLVTLSEEEHIYEERKILDHSSGEITTEEASVLLDAIRSEFSREGYSFYVGTSYRHLLIQKGGNKVELVPPHDILTRQIGEYLPQEDVLRNMMVRSFDILKDHPVNQKRRRAGKNPANSLWFWGAGTRPELPSFTDKYGLKGAMISAVDLLKGIAVGAGMEVLEVEGANGGLHTNYRGKASAAVKALTEEGYDFVYIHVEAPDEMGHQADIQGKIEAIEHIDREIIGPVAETLSKKGMDFRMLILPDHPTPICIRTHTAQPVPYLLYDSIKKTGRAGIYSERGGADSGQCIEKGDRLMEYFLQTDTGSQK